MRHICVTLDDDLHAYLQKIADKADMRSVPHMVRVLLGMVASMSLSSCADIADIAGEIAEMFNDLSDHDAPRYGERTVRHNNRQR